MLCLQIMRGTPPGRRAFLDQHRIFHSRDVEETRAYLGNKDFSLDIKHRHAPDLDVRVNGFFLPGLYVGYIRYGSPVTISAPSAHDDYWIQLPLRGQLEVSLGADSLECSASRGAIASPMLDDCRLRSDQGGTRIQLALRKPALMAHLSALLGRPPAEPLIFAPAIDLTSGYGRSLARYVLAALEDADHGASVLSNPTTAAAFEQFIFTGLLLSHPHSHSEALQRLERPIVPRDVRRALDFMEARLDAPVMFAQIVEAAGVPGRTLLKHFRDWRGTSPMRYLRDARLEKVRDALLRAGPEQSVTAIAMNWGFAHMGRFALEYRRRFGESPSRTLRRRPLN
jgi:AraC-like DNA-binding protein